MLDLNAYITFIHIGESQETWERKHDNCQLHTEAVTERNMSVENKACVIAGSGKSRILAKERGHKAQM